MADKSAEGARMAEHVRNIKDEGTDAVHDAMGATTEYAKQGYDMAAEKTRKAKETTEHYITGNPWYAVGIALGVGVLLGLALRGSRG